MMTMQLRGGGGSSSLSNIATAVFAAPSEVSSSVDQKPMKLPDLECQMDQVQSKFWFPCRLVLLPPVDTQCGKNLTK